MGLLWLLSQCVVNMTGFDDAMLALVSYFKRRSSTIPCRKILNVDVPRASLNDRYEHYYIKKSTINVFQNQIEMISDVSIGEPSPRLLPDWS